jgi:hypothetical protein
MEINAEKNTIMAFIEKKPIRARYASLIKYKNILIFQ